jgi:GNAT superfamily N-acetyltransferase
MLHESSQRSVTITSCPDFTGTFEQCHLRQLDRLLKGDTDGVPSRELIVEVERIWTDDAVQLANAIADLDPSWGTTVFDLADGVAVLCGSGLYLNRAVGVGFERDPSDQDLAVFEARALEVGVSPSIEVCEATRSSVSTMLLSREYVADGRTSALVHDLVDVPRPDPAVAIELCGIDGLAVWQAAAASGWGHDTADRRRASDVYAAAAATVDEPGLMVARSAEDGRVLGCATLKIGNGIATIGGMSTLPDERGRGVQAALIRHRLNLAAAAGCRFATTSAEAGSASERNLLRHGFRLSHTKVEFTHTPGSPTS